MCVTLGANFTINKEKNVYKLFIWSDNQSVAKALNYIYDVGRSCEPQTLPTLAERSPDVFRLSKAGSAYLLENNIRNMELRIALKADLSTTLSDLSKLSTFGLKNIIGEEQVVTTIVKKDTVSLMSKKMGAALSKTPITSYMTICPGKNYKKVSLPSRVHMDAQDIKNFANVTRSKVFKKMDGDLLYLDGAYKNSANDTVAISMFAVTYKGLVDGSFDDTSASGTVKFNSGVESEITVVAFFESKYEAGTNDVVFDTDLNWYDVLKGGKTSVVSMSKMASHLDIEILRMGDNALAEKSKIKVSATPPHDPESKMESIIATYSEKDSTALDNVELNIKCLSADFGELLSSVFAKASQIGVSTCGKNIIYVRDSRTLGCSVSTMSSAELTAATIKEQRVEDDGNEDEDVVNIPMITACKLYGETYSLYSGKKLVAMLPRKLLTKYNPVTQAPKVIRTAKDAVLTVLAKAGGRAMSPIQIGEHMLTSKYDFSTIRSSLDRAYNQGLIKKVENKYYIQIDPAALDDNGHFPGEE